MQGIKSVVDEKELIADWKAGMNQVALMTKHQISNARLRGFLQNLIPKGFRRNRYSKEDVCKDYRNGMSAKEIMRKHGINSAPNVYRIVKSEKKRCKEVKMQWKKETRSTAEPTCPIILRLREKYRNYIQNQKEIGFGQTNLDTYVTVRPRKNYISL